MPLKKTDTLISFPVSTGTYAAMLDEIITCSKKEASASVCIANVHMIVTAYQDRQFGPAVRSADIVTPDGLPLTWAIRLLFGIKQPRVAGMDLLPDLIEAAADNGIPVFFYGGTPDMLNKTNVYLQTTYKQLSIAGMYSPPFRPLSSDEEQQIADTINQSGAKMVFVVLGCPKQEKWMAAMKNRIAAVMIGVGGALPVLIGMQKRAPEWMQKNGLEWLYRLGQEPKRLFRRYAVTNTLFVLLVAAAFVRVRIMGQKPSLQQM
jgi:N-acetylglucosaminyldiphosphoundecaprenol N-acetyl-beta-D-mannosaminyltransferase